MGFFGGVRICFQPGGPQMIPQLNAHLLSLRLVLFSKVGYVTARSAAKNFGNDVCKMLSHQKGYSLGKSSEVPS